MYECVDACTGGTESRLAPHSRRDLISVRSLSQPVTLTPWKSSLH